MPFRIRALSVLFVVVVIATILALGVLSLSAAIFGQWHYAIACAVALSALVWTVRRAGRA